MLIIPAVDLRAGKCVRLVEGRLDNETIYADDPVEIAAQWEKEGASWLHVIDLDGAFAGGLKNLKVIEKILSTVSIPVELGGGIREMAVIERLLSMGVSRVILGTAAIINPSLVAAACVKFGERIIVGIDAREGNVAIEGWGVLSKKSTLDLAREVEMLGIKRVIFTDIWRDGTLKGPNLAAIEELAKATNLKIIAAGGFREADDLHALKKLEPSRVEAVILGKCLYAGTITLADALAIGEELIT
jgi:phosphoribosylformimino-5-aminoimidazole carboxamide ribotide isomerase